MEEKSPKPENGFINILVNIVIPILVLDKGSPWMGSLPALVLALAFPLSYGLYDLLKNKRRNDLALLGLFNTGFTGVFALLGLGGFWFSVKEAFFPALIGVFVLFSAYTSKPLIKTLFFNPQILRMDLIQQKIETNTHKEKQLNKVIKTSTLLLSSSFFLSAILNFYVAIRVFKPLPASLSSEERSLQLNAQIAEMTSASFVSIMLPSMLFMMFILWHLINGIKRTTGLKTEDIFRS